LFEAGPGALLVLDPELRIVAVSDEYLAATMTRREEILGRGLFEVFPDNPDDSAATGESNLRASLDRVRKHLVADSMAVQQYDIRRPIAEGGGFEVRYWSPVNTPLVDGRGHLRHIVHRVADVTEFVQLKQHDAQQSELTSELRERTLQMEAEILRRSAELAQANQELRKANVAKDEFLSRVSHELRTPLTSISGFGELLLHSELTSEQQEWTSIIRQASSHLSSLIDEVLDISTVESGLISLSLSPVALRPLFHEVIALIRPIADRRKVVIHEPTFAGGHGYAFADRQRLKQVLINLLINAVKYNRAEGDVRVAVAGGEGERTRISVSDTGPGIDQASQERLFVAFERLDAAATEVQGTGLGLALSRKLVEAMHGTIGVTSFPGEGSTFWVEMPSGELAAVEAEADRAPLAPLPVREYAAERTLLYVEDVVANVRLLEAILARRPALRMIPAMQGHLGLELAREHHPDLILLDMHLPDIGGDELLARIKADPVMCDIPVVILTAGGAAQREELILAGADGVMSKPVALFDLLDLLDRFLLQEA
jgi:signal transduction histidine kinase